MSARENEEIRRDTPVDVVMPSFGVFALTSRHGRRFQMPSERRPFHKICLVSAGRGGLVVGDDLLPLSEGTVLIVPPGCWHRFSDQPGAPMTLHMVCLHLGRLRLGAAARTAWQALLRQVGPLRPRALGDAYLRGQALRRMRAMVFEQTRRRPHWQLALQAQLDDLLVSLLRASAGPVRPPAVADGVREAISWLEHNFQDEVRMPVLASRVGMNYRTFTMRFRRQTGVTARAYLARLRATYAQQRLQAGASVLDAALEAGFGDLSHFYRVYRAHFGVTPRGAPSRAKAFLSKRRASI